MPNWCSCNLNITSTPEDIGKIEEALQKATSKNYLGDEPFSFKEEWLGNLLCYTGKDPDEVSSGEVCCRGSIEYWEKVSDTQITMDLDTAWSPQFGAFPLFFDYLGVHPEVTYSAEEFGNLLFVTNDPHVDGTYILEDYSGERENTLYDLSEQSLLQTLQYDYGMGMKDGESVEDFIRRAEVEQDISINQFEYEDFETWT